MTKKLLYIMLAVVFPVLIQAKEYKGAEYRTKESFLYGRFEVRYKASSGSGHTSTFFLFNDDFPNTNWNEIDIEILNRYSDDVQFNTIVPQPGINHVHHQFVPFNPAVDFHIYTIEWTQEYVAWFVDGNEVHRQTGEHIAQLHFSQKIMMNIWPPEAEDWVGKWYEQALPKFAYYDYVSYASYTPGSGNIGTGNNFTFQWKDDFDTWDQARWDKATHTFEGNRCDFEPENIVFRNGNMILCLTDNSHPGFVDNNPPRALWARAKSRSATIYFYEAIDSVSGNYADNFRIPGATVVDAHLQDDQRTVMLTIQGIDLQKNYQLFVSNIIDVSENRNKNYGQMVNLIMAHPLIFPVKINVGGDSAAAFLKDKLWDETVEYGYEEGTIALTPTGQVISGTDFPEIYRTERFGVAEYHVRVPNGVYRARLLMAENYFDSTGQRVFDIRVENELLADDLDLFQRAGKFHAVELTTPEITVEDGILDFHFAAEKNFSLLNGLIIEQIYSKVENEPDARVRNFRLFQNYPNPFNSATKIRYFLKEDSMVNLKIFDVKGREVAQILNKNQAKGDYSVFWDAKNRSTGVYFARISVGDEIENMKLLLVK